VVAAVLEPMLPLLAVVLEVLEHIGNQQQEFLLGREAVAVAEQVRLPLLLATQVYMAEVQEAAGQAHQLLRQVGKELLYLHTMLHQTLPQPAISFYYSEDKHGTHQIN
jgi:hypothetical protein